MTIGKKIVKKHPAKCSNEKKREPPSLLSNSLVIFSKFFLVLEKKKKKMSKKIKLLPLPKNVQKLWTKNDKKLDTRR